MSEPAELPFAPADGASFTEPWQARNFAMAVALRDAGRLDWSEWTRALGARLATQPDYHLAWAATLVDVLAEQGLVEASEVEATTAAWHAAAARTPHGAPIELG